MLKPDADAALGAPTFTVVSTVDGSYLDFLSPGVFYKAHTYQSTNGISVGLTPKWSIGGGFIYAKTFEDLTYLNGRSVSSGFTGYLSAAFTDPDFLTLAVSAGVGGLTTNQSRMIGSVLSLADFDSDTKFISVVAQKTYTVSGWSITPRAKVVASQVNAHSYFESEGSFMPAQSSTLGEFAVGGQVGYAITVGDVTLSPNLESNFLYDFILPLYSRDRTAADLRAGVNGTLGKFTFGVSYTTILGRDEYQQYHGGRGFLIYRF